MRGLVKKDFYCLKKSMKLILLVSLGTIYLAVLFTLSARYGNVAKNVSGTAETAARARAEELLTEEEFYAIYTYVIWVILFLPLALMGNIVDCFREDRRAGFGKFCFSLPAREKQIAGARYLSCLLYALLGIVASVTAALSVSLASDRLRFPELLSVIFTFASILLTFVSVVMPLTYLFGADKLDLIQVGTFGAFLAALAILNVPTLKKIGEEIAVAEGGQGGGDLSTFHELIDRLREFLTTKGLFVFLAAALLFLVSYLCSVAILKKKGGRAI